METKKVVMFDFDGVLIDTLLPCYEINAEVNENLSLDAYKKFFEGNIHEANRKKEKIAHPNFEEEYRVRTREIKIPPLLKEVVAELASQYILVIVSSTPSRSIKDILEREDLGDYFKDILGADLHSSKVIKIKMMLEKYAIKPIETLFITDTLGDIKEARECGVDAIGVTWGFQDKGTIEKGNPAKIVENPEDLAKTIQDILC